MPELACPDWPRSSEDLVPLPKCPGPKLEPFDFGGCPQEMEFLEYLGEGTHSHVVKVQIRGQIYALKIFRFCYDDNWLTPAEGIESGDWDAVGAFYPYSEPFSCECRAFGRLKQAGREELAIGCFGYILLDEEHERKLCDKFQDMDFNGDADSPGGEDIRGFFLGRDGRQPPVRAIVKEYAYAPEEDELQESDLEKMLRDVKMLHQLGIIGVDVAARQVAGGRLCDFSTAITTPHFATTPELNPHLTPNMMAAMELDTFRRAEDDYLAFDSMVRDWNLAHAKNKGRPMTVLAFAGGDAPKLPRRSPRGRSGKTKTVDRYYGYTYVDPRRYDGEKAPRKRLLVKPPYWLYCWAEEDESWLAKHAKMFWRQKWGFRDGDTRIKSDMGSAADNQVMARPSSDPYYDLGNFALKVSTQSAEAQTWFNRALLWTYCFNHDEAITCYKQAVAHDENLAIAYWGISFCSGPNYNKTWRLFDEQDRLDAVAATYSYSQEALRRIEHATEWEAAIIKALEKRYPSNDPTRDFTVCDKAYADAMRDVHQRFGDGDFDTVTLFADALMNCAPRKLFDSTTGLPIPTSPVFEVKALLERNLALPGVPEHPGVAHMYIHLMEMSATPEAALRAADMLRDQVPDTGHTYHMPAHIDVLVGDYRRAVEYNRKATLADDKFFKRSGGLTFYSYYRMHDYHSLIYAAMLGGKAGAALAATARMEAAITEDVLRVETPALANWMEFFLAVRVHVYIRFGMWDELLELDSLEDKHLYCVTNVMRHYGRAVAFAATRQVDKADQERERFREASALVPPTRLDFPNKITDILHVATAMLDGEIAYRRGNFDVAFERLRDAIALEDRLPFAEPWGWMLPARHAYAALSLEQGFVNQALQAYAEDLGYIPTPGRAHQHPNNIWALHGYHECLTRCGRDAEAGIIKRLLVVAAAEADVEITSSCFCRLGASVEGNVTAQGGSCHSRRERGKTTG